MRLPHGASFRGRSSTAERPVPNRQVACARHVVRFLLGWCSRSIPGCEPGGHGCESQTQCQTHGPVVQQTRTPVYGTGDEGANPSGLIVLAPVAQLAVAPGSGPGGCECNSHRGHHRSRSRRPAGSYESCSLGAIPRRPRRAPVAQLAEAAVSRTEGRRCNSDPEHGGLPPNSLAQESGRPARGGAGLQALHTRGDDVHRP